MNATGWKYRSGAYSLSNMSLRLIEFVGDLIEFLLPDGRERVDCTPTESILAGMKQPVCSPPKLESVSSN